MSNALHVQVVTLFPGMVAAVGEYGVTGRAVRSGLLTLDCINPREYCDDVHRAVDDRPFGGGPGMVMKYEPCVRAIRAARAVCPTAPRVLLSPQGRRFDQAMAAELASGDALILVAGRYEGIDERIVDAEIDWELSLGDFVLSGGELAAMAVVDSVARLRPGVLGHSESSAEDSFSEGLLDHPHYTRPPTVEARDVPAVLMGGDHAAIARWRRQQALGRTWLRRPDLIDTAALSDEDAQLLRDFEAAHDSADDNE